MSPDFPHCTLESRARPVQPLYLNPYIGDQTSLLMVLAQYSSQPLQIPLKPDSIRSKFAKLCRITALCAQSKKDQCKMVPSFVFSNFPMVQLSEK